MRKTAITLCCVFLVAGIATVATHFTKADSRSYCKIRFGFPDPHEIVLARESESLLVFRSGRIDQEPEKYVLDDGRLAEGVTIPPITLPNGTSYTITSFSEYTDEEPVRRRAMMIDVKIESDETTFYQYCDVELTESAQNLKFAHFDGPLSIGPVTVNWQLPAGTQFVIGGDPKDIRTNVATMDEPNGCWTVLANGEGKFSEDVHPTVTVAFPTTESSPPIVRTFALDEFC